MFCKDWIYGGIVIFYHNLTFLLLCSVYYIVRNEIKIMFVVQAIKMTGFSMLLSTGTEVIMENVNIIVAENLKRIRLSKGWSQKFVADQLGIAQRTISRAETGIGVSKRILKTLCNLYQVTVASVYNEYVQEASKGTQIVPDDVAVGLLIRNSFIQDLEREVILRYTDTIQKKALMMRSDIEQIIPEVLVQKKAYTMQDIIIACMLTNQKTLSYIRQLVIA